MQNTYMYTYHCCFSLFFFCFTLKMEESASFMNSWNSWMINLLFSLRSFLHVRYLLKINLWTMNMQNNKITHSMNYNNNSKSLLKDLGFTTVYWTIQDWRSMKLRRLEYKVHVSVYMFHKKKIIIIYLTANNKEKVPAFFCNMNVFKFCYNSTQFEK